MLAPGGLAAECSSRIHNMMENTPPNKPSLPTTSKPMEPVLWGGMMSPSYLAWAFGSLTPGPGAEPLLAAGLAIITIFMLSRRESSILGKGWRLVRTGSETAAKGVNQYFQEHGRLVEEAKQISHLGSSTGTKGSHPSQSKMREVTLGRILREARRQIRLWLLIPATLFSILLAVVNMTEPMIIGRFWDSVEDYKVTKDLGPPVALLAQRAILVVARYLLHVTVGILFARARCDMTLRMRHEVFARLLRRDTSFYDGVSSSELLERLRRDPETIEAFVDHACERVFQSVIDILCGFYLIMNYPWYLWGGSIILKALPITLITIRAGRLVSMYSVVQRHSLQQADAVAAEALGNIVAVRTHAAESAEELRHSNKTKHYQDVLLHTLLTENLFRYLRSFTRQAMELGFVVLGAWCMVYEGLSMGRLLAFRSCLDTFIRGFNTLSELYAQACKLRRTSVRYFDLLDVKTMIEEEGVGEERKRLVGCEGHLRVEHVDFSYPARSNTGVLFDVSLEVSPGKMLALCGQSGMGKSTLIKLLQRLYDPTHGRVTLDGVDIRDLDVNWYRSKVGYCPQEPVLFDRSIAENIAFGLRLVHKDHKAKAGGGGGGKKSQGLKHGMVVTNNGGLDGEEEEEEASCQNQCCNGLKRSSSSHYNNDVTTNGDSGRRGGEEDDGPGEVTMSDVVQAAMLSNAHDFIMTLPEGYETRVGAGGVLLSGGQRQRIAIARAVIRDPRILLLDEPTNQLDVESEGAIQTAVEMILPTRSVVVIAHRMSTIRKADAIAVIHTGRIIQVGTHEELLQDPTGKYAKLLAEHLGQHNPQFASR